MIKKILMGLGVLFIVLLLAIGSFILYLNFHKPSYEPQTNLNAPIEIPEVGIIKYSDEISEEKPMVALFYVDWCTYCRRFMPVFGELAKKHSDNYNFVVVNCDYPENRNIIEELHISGFPTLFIIDKKLDHKFTMNMSATSDKSIAEEELKNYLNFRNKFVN